jgi:hypothetical protein
MAGKNIRLYTPNWDSVIHSCTKGAWRIAQSEFLVENGGAECAGGIFQWAGMDEVEFPLTDEV